MDWKHFLAAFLGGGLAATVVVSSVNAVRAQGADQAVIHACVSADGTLRVPQRGCEAGEKTLSFFSADVATSSSSPDQPGAHDSRLQDLNRQASALEDLATGTYGSRVHAPFEVRDRGGKVVFSVTVNENSDTYVTQHTDDGTAEFRAYHRGGRLLALSRGQGQQDPTDVGPTPEGVFVGYPPVAGQAFSVYMAQLGDERGIELGRGVESTTPDKYKLLVNGKSALLAGIGQAASGNGILFVADAAGAIRSQASVPESGAEFGGRVAVIGAGNQQIALLRRGETGGGLLLLTNSKGEPMVDAGVHAGNYGLVRAGPGAFRNIPGMLALPGSYIQGKPD